MFATLNSNCGENKKTILNEELDYIYNLFELLNVCLKCNYICLQYVEDCFDHNTYTAPVVLVTAREDMIARTILI